MKFCVNATWDDAPHLDEETKKKFLSDMAPHEIEARTKGIPAIGSGLIYPVPESQFVIDPFKIEEWLPRAYGMDVGWKKTAALWGAWDRNDDTVYIYSEHYRGQVEPSVHADAIRSRGEWMQGAIDPASKIGNQRDGERLLDEYIDLGLNLHMADNAVEAGLLAVYKRLAAGKLKIFRTCQNLITEMRLYHRNDKGKVVKENDHLVDCLRYLIMTGLLLATIRPEYPDEFNAEHSSHEGRSDRTGY